MKDVILCVKKENTQSQQEVIDKEEGTTPKVTGVKNVDFINQKKVQKYYCDQIQTIKTNQERGVESGRSEGDRGRL